MRTFVRVGTKVLLFAGTPILLVLALSGTAGAHVTVHPETLPAGSTDVEVTFRVPNERDNANTVAVQVYFPPDRPFLAVDVLPVPGWSAQVDTETLTTPIRTDDGLVTQIVKHVTWTAANGGLTSGQYEDFTIGAGTTPNVPGQLVFKALQTYSNGEIVRWIEVANSQLPKPDTPAPILTLTPSRSATTPAAPVSSSSNSNETLAIIALVVATIGLVVVIVILFSGRRKSNRGEDAPQAGVKR